MAKQAKVEEVADLKQMLAHRNETLAEIATLRETVKDCDARLDEIKINDSSEVVKMATLHLTGKPNSFGHLRVRVLACHKNDFRTCSKDTEPVFSVALNDVHGGWYSKYISLDNACKLRDWLNLIIPKRKFPVKEKD